MPRALRNKAKVNYAELASLDIGEAEVPSHAFLDDDDQSSGSDFEPEIKGDNKGSGAVAGDEDADEDDELDDEEEDELEDDVVDEDDDDDDDEPLPKSKGKGKGRAAAPTQYTFITTSSKRRPKKPLNARVTTGQSGHLAGNSKRQQYALPTPRVHHRHQATPLFWRTGRVERLLSKPLLFTEPKTIQTWNFTHSKGLVTRISRSWGYNVGNGPVWEAVEDRAWFKECPVGKIEREATRRPRVHQNVAVRSGLAILNESDASSFLPTDDVTTEEGSLKPPPPVICSFGPHTSQQKLSIPMFTSIPISTFFPDSESHVFNAGAPVWTLDWCPLHINSRAERGNKQYLAVCPYPSKGYQPEIGVKVSRPSRACIQIWSLQKGGDGGIMRCEMVVCHDSGVANQVKWCPLPSHDAWPAEDENQVRKLGLLGGTFQDGSFSLYVIPDPEDVRPEGHDPSQPFYVKLDRPLLRIELEECGCWCFDWANSELIAIGTTHGIIAVYHLSTHLKSPSASDAGAQTITTTSLLPSHYITAHQSGIRSLAWMRVPPVYPSGEPNTGVDPTLIASGGYDGLEVMTDIRDGLPGIMNRTRDVINTVTYSIHGSGPVSIDHDNMIKSFCLAPIMLGRGHSLVDPMGPVWSLHCSDYHPQLAIGSADGTCMTTNVLRATRRGGPAPFFSHKIYQLDYSRKEGEFRMLERFLPVEVKDRSAQNKNRPKKPTSSSAADSPPMDHIISTGAWPGCISVTSVSWNSGNGLSAAGLLASATASGLCRVDNLWGRWVRGQVPYTGIVNLRFEGDPVGGAGADSEPEDDD